MKKNTTITFLLLLLATGSLAEGYDKDACTSIMVGKKASTDGSVITSHTCDSWYRTWMNIVPEKDYPKDTLMSIYEGTMHTEHAGDQTGIKEKGKIPQAKHTYRYLNTAYPCLNEHQLGIGETTYGGRDTMENKAGMFNDRGTGAYCLGTLHNSSRSHPSDGRTDKEIWVWRLGRMSDHCHPNEVWIFEVQGEGPKKIGGVWAAQRIPDNEIAVSANVSRIGRIDLSDPDHFMASENVLMWPVR